MRIQNSTEGRDRAMLLPLPDGTDQSTWHLWEHSGHHVAGLRCIDDSKHLPEWRDTDPRVADVTCIPDLYPLGLLPQPWLIIFLASNCRTLC
jgi:hypothetical protein